MPDGISVAMLIKCVVGVLSHLQMKMTTIIDDDQRRYLGRRGG
jgi:hypothetical protein